MPSSTYSSDASGSDIAAGVVVGGDTAFRRMPEPWPGVLVGALALLAIFVAVTELRLAARGIRATAVDSEALWIRERARASRLGERAIILIGASRVQTGIDPDVLRSRTGLEPVQLAIDGSSFVPVLEGLARDPSVRGTVIVGYYDESVAEPRDPGSVADRYEAHFEATNPWLAPFSFDTIEGELTDAVRSRLRNYADGARPLTSLTTRILAPAAPQYAIVLADRSRLADYAHVDPRVTYYNRVVRELGQKVSFPAGADYREIDAELTRRVDALEPGRADDYARNAAAVAADAAKIEARGGHVYFVVMPTSGLVTRMEEKRYPRAAFWDRFAAEPNVHAVHFEDVPGLKAIPVPDGSHVDYHSRAPLTRALLDAFFAGK